jgi:ATP-dependent DNA ligase
MTRTIEKIKIPVMLVSPMKELKRINFPCFAQTKMDGQRGVIVKRNGVVTVFSRNGSTMVGLDEHFQIILEGIDNVVIDGEITVRSISGGFHDRKTGNGMCNKTVVNGDITPEEISRFHFTAWDIIDVCDFDKGIDKRTGRERLEKLRGIAKHERFSIVETFEVADIEQAHEIFKELLAKGQEGIILKNNDHPWEDKRSKQCVKMKAELEMDLEITGFAEGQGKNANMCGAIQCKSKDGSIIVDVGTGLNDADRIDIWSRQEELIGTIVEVKYNEVIQAKTDKPASLYLPVFVELRTDKGEAN